MKRIFLAAIAAATLSVSASAGAQEDADTGQSPVPVEVAPAPVREGFFSWLFSWDSTSTDQNSKAIVDLQRRQAALEECVVCDDAPAPKPPPVHHRSAPKPTVTPPAPGQTSAPVTTTTVAPEPTPPAKPDAATLDELTTAVVERIKERHEFATPADVRSVLSTNCAVRPDVPADPLDPYNSLLCVQFRTLKDEIKGVGDRVTAQDAVIEGIKPKYNGFNAEFSLGGQMINVPGEHPETALVGKNLGGFALGVGFGWRNPDGFGFQVEPVIGFVTGHAKPEAANSKTIFGALHVGPVIALGRSFELLPSATWLGGINGLGDSENYRSGDFSMFGGGVAIGYFLAGDHLGMKAGVDVAHGPRKLALTDDSMMESARTAVDVTVAFTFRTHRPRVEHDE